MIAPRSQSSIRRVVLYATALGNDFMTEIARMFQSGFQALALEAELLLDEIPLRDPPSSLLQLIVAPHEFVPLFLEPRVSAAGMPGVLADCCVLTVEQPGSVWFEIGYPAAKSARAVFDINGQAVEEYRRRGLPAQYARLGYAPLLGEITGTLPAQKSIDVVFMGWLTDRRARFFAKHASALGRYNCRLLFIDAASPILATSPHYYAGARRNALLRNAKILLNIHHGERRYFEWHRALCALANRCLFVSESSDHTSPLESGRHLLFAKEAELLDRCEHYLHDDSARAKIVDEGYRIATNELAMVHTCRAMLDFLDQHARGSTTVATPPDRAKSPPQSASAQHFTNPSARTVFALNDEPLISPNGSDPRVALEAHRNTLLENLARISRTLPAESQRYPSFVSSTYPRTVDPIVTVVLNLYNRAEQVRPCLESVARAVENGLPGPVEIVVVDDASGDESVQEVRTFLEHTSLPLRLVLKDASSGPAHTRNVGIHLARAPYVFPLEPDRIIFPKCLSVLYQAITSTGTAGAYGILGIVDDRTGEGLGLLSQLGWDVARLVKEPYLDSMALLDRARILEMGGYPADLLRYGWRWDDYALWLRLAQANLSCTFHPDLLGTFRRRGEASWETLSLWYHWRNLGAVFRSTFAPLITTHGSEGRWFGFSANDIPPVGVRLDPLQPSTKGLL
jgi:Glycosyl transferase family 2